MSTVAVTYELKTLKVKVTPSTPSNDILYRAAAHFKLDPATTCLFHNNKEISAGLPFRLLNLPAGAKLTLKLSKSKKSSEITVKVQFINSTFSPSSIVKKFDNQQTLRSAVQDVEKELSVEVFGKGYILEFQSITRAVTEDEIDTLTLAHFGIENSGVLKVRVSSPFFARTLDKNIVETEQAGLKKGKTFEMTPVKSVEPVVETTSTGTELIKSDVDNATKIKNAATVAKSLELDLITISESEPTPELKKPSSELPKEIPQHVYIYKPTDNPINRPKTEDELYEVTVSHARIYQNMLSKAANETDKTKRLRQEAQKKSLTNIEIRFKFPDNSVIQANFKATDTNERLYIFVKSKLINESEEFTLSIPYPPKDLKNDTTTLITNLESRNLLIFTSSKKTDLFLKEEYTSKAQGLSEAEEVRLDLNRHLINDEEEDEEEIFKGKIYNGVIPKKKDFNFKNEENKDAKIPKWMKIGKK